MIHTVKETTPNAYRTFDLAGITAEELQIILEALAGFIAEEPQAQGTWEIRVAKSMHAKVKSALGLCC